MKIQPLFNVSSLASKLDKRIAAAENDMNEMVCGLYGLTDEEIVVVESG